MIVLVCGGRDYTDTKKVCQILDEHVTKDDVIIQGGCSGADDLAYAWCKLAGVHCATMEPLWGHHGKAAGPLRNKALLSLKPDKVIAFPGGAGTNDCLKQAEGLGIRTILVLDAKQD